MNWFYEQDSQQRGPISAVELKSLHDRGELGDDNLVWCETMEDWASYKAVFELNEQTVEIVPPEQRMRRERSGNSCRELRAEGLVALAGNWWMAVLAIFLTQVVIQASGMIPLAGLIAPFLVMGPMTVGLYSYYLKLARGAAVDIGQIFSGFNLWLKHTGLILLVTLIVIGSMFISAIPGGALMGFAVSQDPEFYSENPDLLIKNLIFMVGLGLITIIPMLVGTYFWLRYVLVYFIAVDEPEMRVVDTLGRSSQMMKGQMWKFSWLLFSYTGWYILGFLAFFVGLLWSTAYAMAGFAAFYEDLRKRQP
ncbi:MAG: DUF975 family protein [Akkermansiaceae bacterium]